MDNPLFHVRFIQDGVEQEQIFVGVPDGRDGFRIDVPTPCTLLSVTQHSFPYCAVCDGGPAQKVLETARRLFEAEQASGSSEPSVFEGFFEEVDDAEDRAAFIRAEVEAMDWPEVIGE